MDYYYSRLKKTIKNKTYQEKVFNTLDKFIKYTIRVDKQLYKQQLEQGNRNYRYQANHAQ